MARIALGDRSFILDAETVIRLISPKANARNRRCLEWFTDLRARGARFYVPSFALYEAERGALENAAKGDGRENATLRTLVRSDRVGVLTINNTVLRSAARLWADARASGRTLDDRTISGDSLVVAEAGYLSRKTEGKVIVSDNVTHLSWLSPIRVAPFDQI